MSAPLEIPPGAPRPAWWQWIGLALLFGVMVELTVRVEDWVRHGTPFLSPYHRQGQLIVRDADGMHGRPNARFRKWILNNLGMRGPDVSPEKAKGEWRLITVGASESFGLYESPGREYPRQLGDTLEAMRRDGRCRCAGISRINVLNGALLGMTLPTVVQDVRLRLARLSPDAILFYPTPPDYLLDTVPVPARPDSSGRGSAPPSWQSRLVPRFADRARDQAKLMLPGFVKDWLRRREIDATLAAHPAGWLFETVPPERLDRYEADLRMAVGAIRAIGAIPVLASHGNAFPERGPRDRMLLTAWERFYPRATGDVIVDFDEAAAARTSRVAADSALPFVDWHALSRTAGPGSFADFSHFNDLGAARVAQAMARSIVARIDGGG